MHCIEGACPFGPDFRGEYPDDCPGEGCYLRRLQFGELLQPVGCKSIAEDGVVSELA